MKYPSNIFAQVFSRIRRKPLALISNTLIVSAAIWAFMEPILGMVKTAQPFLSGWDKYIIFLAVSAVIGITTLIIPEELVIKRDSSIIRVKFGDLFTSDGLKVIPVSRFFFETEVVQGSLQDNVIREYLGAYEGGKGLEVYQQQLHAALHEIPYEDIFRQETQRPEKYYHLGTTAYLDGPKNAYALFALTKTELRGHVPPDNCSITDMWIALQEFWSNIRKTSRGRLINIPLLGSGVTGIHLPPAYLLQFNLLAILSALAEGGKISSSEIRIILHQKFREEIDLDFLKRFDIR